MAEDVECHGFLLSQRKFAVSTTIDYTKPSKHVTQSAELLLEPRGR